MNKDIVEFVEDICGIKLLEPQKRMLREIHEKGPDCRLVMCKDNGRTYMRGLAMIANSMYLERRRYEKEE